MAAAAVEANNKEMGSKIHIVTSDLWTLPIEKCAWIEAEHFDVWKS
jgi:hypothetical protein